MPLSLGPMPVAVQRLVEQLVRDSVDSQGFMLTGGPGGASYLDANGQVWQSYWGSDGEDDPIELVPDGPMKVAPVCIAARRIPGLAEWLPRRPPTAVDCLVCRGTGVWPPVPLPSEWYERNGPKQLNCPQCQGLGWLPIEDDAASE